MSDIPPLPKNKKADAPNVCKCLIKCCTQCYDEEDVKAYSKKLAAGIKKRYEQLQKERDKKLNGPPDLPTGTCVMCNGDVIAEHAHVPIRDVMSMPIGPASRQWYRWEFQGYHCVSCGLMYKFAPKGHIKK